MKLSRSVVFLAFGLSLSTTAFAVPADGGDITLYEDTVQALGLENEGTSAVSNGELSKPYESSGQSDDTDSRNSQDQNEHGVVVSGNAQTLVDGAKENAESGDVEFKDAIREGASALSQTAREESEKLRSDVEDSIEDTIKDDAQELAQDAAEQAADDSSRATADLVEMAKDTTSDNTP